MEGKRGSECLLKSVSNIDFNPDRSNARKASGKSVFSYDDLKGLRKLAFWLFVFSIFLNWGMFGAIMLIAWLAMWAISIIF